MRPIMGILCVVCGLLFVGWIGVRTYDVVVFNRTVGGYLKRAADANTVDLAVENMTIAVNQLKTNGMTTGYTTALLWTSPSEDVGYWFSNLTASLNELRSIKPDTSLLERTNVLIKLRQTLLDHGKEGETVTEPDGISVFPNNTGFAIWGWLSFILAWIFGAIAAAND